MGHSECIPLQLELCGGGTSEGCERSPVIPVRLETGWVQEENLLRSSSSRSLTGSVRSLTESVKKTAGIVNIASVVLQHWSSITV